jgi:Chaperone of endosialidase
VWLPSVLRRTTAYGFESLLNTDNNSGNTGFGYRALPKTTTGNDNVAIGGFALQNNTTGNQNIALGNLAGANVTGNGNIDIANVGNAADSHTIRIGNVFHERSFIAGIRGVTTGQTNAIPVLIDSDGQLGTVSSSRRFKDGIRPMDKASETIHALKPVTFHYKSDNTHTPQFGLIAEEVARVNPDLVVRNENAEIYTVRHEAVNAMLLNEFLKAHRKMEEQSREVEQQKVTINELRKAMESVVGRLKEQDSTIQKISDRLESGGTASRLASNTP